MLVAGHLHRIVCVKTARSQVRTDHLATFHLVADLATGVYFDVIVANTTSLLLALYNAPEPALSMEASTPHKTVTPVAPPNHQHFNFHSILSKKKPSPPVSLLAQVDNQEYILLPNASSLVSISSNDLDNIAEHRIRVVAPMTDNHGCGVVELDGLWLSKGGKLVKVPGSLLSEDYADEDLLKAENDQIGEKHRLGLHDIEKDGTNRHDRHTLAEEQKELQSATEDRKKILEVITDSPGSYTSKQRGRRSGGPDSLLAGVMGWEYLLGEMFGADHIGIGVDGMCLIPDCIDGTGQPAGLGDVFFRRSVQCSLR